MQFSQVIGHADIKLKLHQLVTQNRVSHALLFLGKEGSGALPMAVAFAQYLVCEKVRGREDDSHLTPAPSLFGEPADEPSVKLINAEIPTDSCGVCSSCLKSAQQAHPDIHFSFPVIPQKSGDKPISTDFYPKWREFLKDYPYGNLYDWLQSIGAENKQGNITARECEEIIRILSLKSFESGYKILVMWMPENLGKEGNKLLKMIEEPPPNTLFILVAEDETRILPTIISRTQLIRIPAYEVQEIKNALMERSKLNEDQAGAVAALADGNYREALQLVLHAGEDWQTLVRDWLNAILKGGPVAQIKWVDDVSKLGREKQKQLLRYFNHLLESSIRLNLIGEEKILIPEKELDFARRINKFTSLSQQKALIEENDKAAYYIERNANAKMLFQALTIKMSHIISDNSLILIN